MARPLLSGRTLTAFTRRYRLGRFLLSIWDTILPVAVIDTHWQDDTLDVWGLFGQATPGAGTIGAVQLQAQEKELLVHRVTAYVQNSATGGALSEGLHCFTPLQAYDPTAIGRAIHYPWMQPETDIARVRLSRAFCFSGAAAAHMTVLIGGVPVLAFGPLFQTTFGPIGSAEFPPREYWGFQNPPYRLPPFGSLCVQQVLAAAGNELINVNFWYSEREDQGRVG